MRFSSTCEPLASPPNFQFDVYEDGRVRYFGGDLVRERGERQYRIRRGEAARLAARVRNDLNRSEFDRHHPPNLPLNWGDNGKMFDDRCLLLAINTNAVSAEGTILLASAVGNELDDRLNRALGVATLVCPDRYGGRLSKHCDNLSFGFSVSWTRETCASAHQLNFYSDGVVHYFVPELADSDRYFKLERGTIGELAEKAAALPGETITFPTGSAPPSPQYPRVFFPTFIIDAAATSAFADEIAIILRLEWQQTPLTPDPTRCGLGPFGRSFPRGGTSLPPSMVTR